MTADYGLGADERPERPWRERFSPASIVADLNFGIIERFAVR